MPATPKVAVLVGSLRQASLNRKLAQALTTLSAGRLTLDIVEIGQLPFYNEDQEADPPQAWRDFRALIRSADAVLLVSPEYNRSIPAALKNAIDVGSRPYGQAAWSGKPGAILTSSPGLIGGFGAHHHLRQALAALNVPLLPSPEAYISKVDSIFDEQGAIKTEATRTFLEQFLNAFAAWIHQVNGPSAGGQS